MCVHVVLLCCCNQQWVINLHHGSMCIALVLRWCCCCCCRIACCQLQQPSVEGSEGKCIGWRESTMHANHVWFLGVARDDACGGRGWGYSTHTHMSTTCWCVPQGNHHNTSNMITGCIRPPCGTSAWQQCIVQLVADIVCVWLAALPLTMEAWQGLTSCLPAPKTFPIHSGHRIKGDNVRCN